MPPSGGRYFFLFMKQDAPPSSFSPRAEKKKSAVHGGEEKEGLDSRLGGSRPSILLCRWIEHCAVWCPVVTLLVLLTALRAGAGEGFRACKFVQ